MSACVVCQRECERGEVCQECLDSNNSVGSGWLNTARWAAQRALEFAYEECARMLEAEAAGFAEEAGYHASKGHIEACREKGLQASTNRAGAAAIRARSGK